MIKKIILVFLGIMISLAFAQYDFSGMQYGFIINFFGSLSAIAIPFGFILYEIKKLRE